MNYSPFLIFVVSLWITSEEDTIYNDNEVETTIISTIISFTWEAATVKCKDLFD